MRSFFRGAVVTTLIGAFAVAGGCAGDDTIVRLDSDSGSQDATTAFDGGPPLGDAALDGARPPDTGAIDSPVVITALGSAGPIAGANVVFYSPDGTPHPPLVTGADGTVSAVVAAGSSVTITLFSQPIDGPLYDVTSFLEIAPGDRLTATPSRSIEKNASDPGSVTVTAPGAVMSATAYDFANGCDAKENAGGDQVLAVGPECIGAGDGGTLGIFVAARKGDGSWLASAEAVGAGYVDGGTITGLAWSPITPTLLPVTGAPSGAPVGFGFDVAYFAGFLFYADVAVNETVSGTFTAPQIALPTSALFTDKLSIAALDYPPSSTPGAHAEQITQTRIGSPISVDFAAMPPNIRDAIATTDGAGNSSLSFTPDGPLTGFDGLTASYAFTVTLADGGAANGTWTVISPPRATITMPKLTTDLLPAFPATLALSSAVLVQGTQYGSYGVYRRAYPRIAVHGELASAPYRVEAVFFQGN